MGKKPSYLGLLNAIAIGEQRGHRLFNAWAETTPNMDLAKVLRKVALREQDHATTFARRVNELDYDLRPSPTEEFEAAMQLVCSRSGDKKKFEKLLNYFPPEDKGKKKNKKKKDPLARIFRDKSIDIQTGALLGRFIAEERDSERLLRACYATLCSQDRAKNNAEMSAEIGAENSATEASLKDLGQRLDRLSTTLKELKQLQRQNH